MTITTSSTYFDFEIAVRLIGSMPGSYKCKVKTTPIHKMQDMCVGVKVIAATPKYELNAKR
eukprot:3801711-Amphidinium_carterae.2